VVGWAVDTNKIILVDRINLELGSQILIWVIIWEETEVTLEYPIVDNLLITKIWEEGNHHIKMILEEEISFLAKRKWQFQDTGSKVLRLVTAQSKQDKWNMIIQLHLLKVNTVMEEQVVMVKEQ
jgi:hypothetical protein